MLCAQAWKPGSQHAGEKRGVAGLFLGRTERAARAAELHRTCWARLYCSGGCAANAYHATGSVTGVYAAGCELFRKRMECAIALQAALQTDGDA